jgi:hypothetical protein
MRKGKLPTNERFCFPPVQQLSDREHLTLDETAEWLRCSTRTLQRLLEDGSGPPAFRLSQRRLIFRIADLRAWLSQRGRRGWEQPRPSRRRASKVPQQRQATSHARGATP